MTAEQQEKDYQNYARCLFNRVTEKEACNAKRQSVIRAGFDGFALGH